MSLRWHLWWSRVFVLVASPAAVDQSALTIEEVRRFVDRVDPIFVPIDFDGSYARIDRRITEPWIPVSGAATEHEPLEALQTGKVSTPVVDRIGALVGERTHQRRLQIATTVSFVLIVLGAIFFWRALVVARQARANEAGGDAIGVASRDYALGLLLAARSTELDENLILPRAALLDVLHRHPGLVRLVHPAVGPSNEGFARDVSLVAVSPDRSVVVTGQASGIIRFWDAALLREIRPPVRQDSRPLRAIFDQSGNRVAVGSLSDVGVWDLRGRTGMLAHLGFAALSGSFTPEGNLLSLNDDGKIVDITSPDRVVAQVDRDAMAFAVSQDQTRMIVGRAKGELSVYDWPAARPLRIALPKLKGTVWMLAANPARPRMFAAADDNGVLALFDLDTNGAVTFSASHDARIAFDAAGRLMVTDGATISVRQPPLYQQPEVLTYAAAVTAVAGAPSDGMLMSGNRDGTIALWSLRDEDPLRGFGSPLVTLLTSVPRRPKPPMPSPLSAKCVGYFSAVSGDGRVVAVLARCGSNHSVLLYRSGSASPQRVDLETDAARTIAIDSRGDRIAIGERNGRVTIRRTTSAASPIAFEIGIFDVNALAFAGDSKTLLASDFDALYLYDVASGVHIGDVNRQASWIAPSADGRTVVFGSDKQSWTMSMDLAVWRAIARRVAGRAMTDVERREYGGL
jgi:WD40 repeat protein